MQTRGRYIALVLAVAGIFFGLMSLRNRFYGELTATITLDAPGDMSVQATLSCEFNGGKAPSSTRTVSLKNGANAFIVGNVPFNGQRLTAARLELAADTPAGCRIQTFSMESPRRGMHWARPPAQKQARSASLEALDQHLPFRSRQYVFMHAMVGLAIGLLCAEVARFLAQRRQARNPRGSLFAYVFIADGRWVFWLSSLLVICGSMVALIGDWPALMFPDTGKMLWQFHRPLVSKWNGYAWESFMMAPLLLWDSPAAPALVQILMFAGLVGTVAFLARRWGGTWGTAAGIVAAVIMATLPSVTSSTITVFKDTPYAVVTIGLSVLLWAWGMRAKSTGKWAPIRLSAHTLAWAAVLLFFASTFRHNGIVMLLGFPLILLAYRMIAIRQCVLLGICGIMLVFAGNHFVGEKIFQASRNRSASLQHITILIQPWGAFATDKWFYSPDPAGDRAAVDEVMGWDRVRNNYDPKSSWETWNEIAGPWPYIPYEKVDAVVQRTVRASLDNPSTIIGDRFHMFIELVLRPHAVGAHLMNDYRRFGWKWLDTNMLFECYKFQTSPPREERSVFATSRVTERHRDQFRSFWARDSLLWNSGGALLLVCVLFFLYKWLPATSTAAASLLFLLPFLALTLPGAEFRYIYFLYLSQFILPVLAIVELIARHQNASGVRLGRHVDTLEHA